MKLYRANFNSCLRSCLLFGSHKALSLHFEDSLKTLQRLYFNDIVLDKVLEVGMNEDGVQERRVL